METSQLFDLIAHGDDEAVLAAVRREPELAAARTPQGVSVVCVAMYRQRRGLALALAELRTDLDIFEASCVGDVERVKALLRQDASLIEAVSPDGFGPLGFSAFFGHLPLLQELVSRGANVNAASRNAMKVQPLHSAAACADPATSLQLSRVLLEAGADPNAAQQGGYRPLHEAALHGKVPLIALLLGHGADRSLGNDQGSCPVDLARSSGMVEAVDVLVAAAEMNHVLEGRNTPPSRT